MRTGLAAVLARLITAVALSLGPLLATAVAAGPASAQQAPPAEAPPEGDKVQVDPTDIGFPGGAMVQKLINWAAQFALWGSVVSLLIGAGIWGVSQQFGNGYQSGKGKTLAAAGAVGAVLTGLAGPIVNTLFRATGS